MWSQNVRGNIFSYPIHSQNWNRQYFLLFPIEGGYFLFWSTFIQKTETFWKSRLNARVHFSNSNILPWPCTSTTISTQDLWLALSTNVTKHNWSISEHFLPKFSAYTLPFGPLSAKPLVNTIKAFLLAQLLHLFTLSTLVFDLLLLEPGCCTYNPENWVYICSEVCFTYPIFYVFCHERIFKFLPLYFWYRGWSLLSSFSYFHYTLAILITKFV